MDQINWAAIGAIILPNLGGIAGSIIVKNNMDWYESLNHSALRPPNWVFGPVWTALYSGIGYGSYLAIRDGGGLNDATKLPLLLYGGNLLVNWAWTPIFFGAHNLKVSLIDINLVTLTAIGTGLLFYKLNPVAGLIFIPYALWTSFATILNYQLWRDNPDEPKITEIKDK